MTNTSETRTPADAAKVVLKVTAISAAETAAGIVVAFGMIAALGGVMQARQNRKDKKAQSQE